MAVAQSGYLPRGLKRLDKNNVNRPVLPVQGVFVSLLLLIVLPTVESAYQIMSQMATIIYLVMAVMIYGAFLRLRRTQPGKPRGYRVPFGKAGETVTCTLGISGAILALVLSYQPPEQISVGSPAVYVGIILTGVAVMIAMPLVVYAFRNPPWRNPSNHFYPFDWQIEGRRPGEVSKWPAGYVPTEEEVEKAEARVTAPGKQCP